MTGQRPGISVYQRRAFLIAAGLGLLMVGGAVGVAVGAVGGSPPTVEQQIETLDREYERLAEEAGPGEQHALNEQYEKEFAEIGGEAPNQEVAEHSAADYVERLPDFGIRPVGEQMPGYVLVNRWVARVAGAPYVVVAGSLEDDPDQGGLLVMAESGLSFHPTPAPNGAAEIVDASGSTVTVRTTGGSLLVFDVVTGKFAGV